MIDDKRKGKKKILYIWNANYFAFPFTGERYVMTFLNVLNFGDQGKMKFCIVLIKDELLVDTFSYFSLQFDTFNEKMNLQTIFYKKIIRNESWRLKIVGLYKYIFDYPLSLTWVASSLLRFSALTLLSAELWCSFWGQSVLREKGAHCSHKDLLHVCVAR